MSKHVALSKYIILLCINKVLCYRLTCGIHMLYFLTFISLEVPESHPVYARHVAVVMYRGLYTLALAPGNTLTETLDINSSGPSLYFKGKY